MDQFKIIGLNDLLSSKLPPGSEVISYKAKPLTAPGDNYGSEMLALTVLIRKKTEKSCTTLELVAKRPPNNKQLLAIFQTSRTFIKENSIYTIVAPCVAEFEREVGLIEDKQRLNVFCECFGARISIKPKSNLVDGDALLLLRNMKVLNYRTADRLIGLDSEHSKLVLSELAKFHATFIAIKLLKPNLFKDAIFPFIDKVDIDAGMEEESKIAMIESIKSDVRKVAPPLYRTQLMELIDCCIKKQMNLNYPKDRPYVTVIHNDFWINNILIGYENQRPTAIKMIDYQFVSCDSLVHDVIFFILSSIKDECLDGMMDMWLSFYHEKFYKHLKLLGCPTDAYSYENFVKEIKLAAPLELYHILSMLKVVFAKQESIPELDNLKDDIFADDNLVGDEYFARLTKVIKIYIKRHWVESQPSFGVNKISH